MYNFFWSLICCEYDHCWLFGQKYSSLENHATLQNPRYEQQRNVSLKTNQWFETLKLIIN